MISQQVPGLAINLPARISTDNVGIEAQAFLTFYGGYRYDIPNIAWNDIGHQEVDIFRRVFSGRFSFNRTQRFDLISAIIDRRGALKLHAVQPLAGIENKVITIIFAPGFGYAKVQAFSLHHEGGFCNVSVALSISSIVIRRQFFGNRVKPGKNTRLLEN